MICLTSRWSKYVIKVGYILKIVYASTTEQELKIKNLVEYFYSSVFPVYFSEEEISKFEKMNFLNILGKNELTGTLKESYQIISGLETLIFLIESNGLEKSKYQEMYERNVQILEELGFSFPFSYEQFLQKRDFGLETDSVYIKPSNQFIM
jgi:hypothetical protein